MWWFQSTTPEPSHDPNRRICGGGLGDAGGGAGGVAQRAASKTFSCYKMFVDATGGAEPETLEEARAAWRSAREALAARELQLERKGREVSDVQALCRQLQVRHDFSGI